MLLRHFEALARVEGVRLISLQVGEGAEQLVAAPFPIVPAGPDSLDNLAAALLNLDLVVSVCTSVAHLAGALGVPTWIALSYSSDCALAAGPCRQSVVSDDPLISSTRPRRLAVGL